MPKFTVSLETHAAEDLDVEAATPHEAFKLALAAVGDGGEQRRPLRWKVTSAEGEDGALYNVAGACEACGQELLENEDGERLGVAWSTDEDGIQFHDGECPAPAALPGDAAGGGS